MPQGFVMINVHTSWKQWRTDYQTDPDITEGQLLLPWLVSQLSCLSGFSELHLEAGDNSPPPDLSLSGQSVLYVLQARVFNPIVNSTSVLFFSPVFCFYRVSVCSSSWAETHYVVQVITEIEVKRLLPLSSQCRDYRYAPVYRQLLYFLYFLYAR